MEEIEKKTEYQTAATVERAGKTKEQTSLMSELMVILGQLSEGTIQLQNEITQFKTEE